MSVGMRLLAAVAAGEGEIALQHPVHVVDVGLQLLDVGVLLDQRELQPKAGSARCADRG